VSGDTGIAEWVCLAGLSDVPGEAMVKLYCPKCQDIYVPKSSRHHHTDGAYFGTGFPHMLFMVHPEYRPKRPVNQFVARCCLHLTLLLLAVTTRHCLSVCLSVCWCLDITYHCQITLSDHINQLSGKHQVCNNTSLDTQLPQPHP